MKNSRPTRCPLQKIKQKLMAIAAKSGFGARLYYLLAKPCYGIEQRKILAGQLRYYKELQAPSGTMALLRRNIHRLEKGMIMRPQRIPFALDYIEETVNAYGISITHAIDPQELEWATDVLTEYFRLHSGQPAAAVSHNIFSNLQRTPGSPEALIPYLRSAPQASVMDETGLAQLAQHRRSVRWFLPQTVPREKIDRALEIAALSPSACNRQPYRFQVIDDPILAEKIISIPGGTAGFSHNVPVVAVAIGQYRHYFNERDRHLIYIDTSLAIMSLLYGLEAQGISSCCVNWPDVASRDHKLSTLLPLSPDERVVMLVAIGYADPSGRIARSHKKSLNQLRIYNREQPTPRNSP